MGEQQRVINAPKPLCTFNWSPNPALTRDENFLDLAVVLARNSKREGGHMGCVLTDASGQLLALSVNSSLYDLLSHKSDVHAEANAVSAAARVGRALQGASAYITMPPCRTCFGLLQAAGITRIVTRHATTHEDMLEAASRLGIEMVSPWDFQADLDSQQRAKDTWNSYIAQHPEYAAAEREQAAAQKEQVKQFKVQRGQSKAERGQKQQGQQGQGQGSGGGDNKKRKQHEEQSNQQQCQGEQQGHDEQREHIGQQQQVACGD